MSLRDESPWDLVEFFSENVFWVKKGIEKKKRKFWKTVILCPLKAKNLLISRVRYSWSYSQNGSKSQGLFHGKLLLAKESWRSHETLKEFFNKQNGLFGKTLNTKNSIQKHFQKHIKYSKIFLGLIIKQLSIYMSHLNTYNHTNEISIHWTLNLCVVCVDQVWTSP